MFPVEAVKGPLYKVREEALDAARTRTRRSAAAPLANVYWEVARRHTRGSLLMETIEIVRDADVLDPKRFQPSLVQHVINWARTMVGREFLTQLATWEELHKVLAACRTIVNTAVMDIPRPLHYPRHHVRSKYTPSTYYWYGKTISAVERLEQEIERRKPRIATWLMRRIEPSFDTPNRLGPAGKSVRHLYWGHIAPFLTGPEIAKAELRVKRPRDAEDEEEGEPAKLQRRS